MKALSIKLGWHKHAKQFRKVIGRAYTKAGKLSEKVWFLGADESAAVQKAMQIQTAWDQLTASGGSYWTQDQIERLNGGSSVPVPSTSMTVSQAAEAYLTELRERMEAHQLSTVYYRHMKQRMNAVMDRVGQYLPENRPIATIGEGEVRMAVLTLVKCDGIGPVYAQNLLKTLKWFLTWAHEMEYWDQPRRFNRLFKVKLAKNQTEPRYFSLDELKAIWKAAECPRHRCWILLAINCGFGPMELATLKRSEIKGDHIERMRQKTGVYGKWKLWTETQKALRAVMAEDGDLALLTKTGTPLIEEFQTERRDAISQSWRWIQRRSGVKGSFKLLRKTAATMIKQIAGLEASEMMLAHTEPGINKAYAGRQWDKLDDALMVMWKQLQAMFAAA
jgi:integrase